DPARLPTEQLDFELLFQRPDLHAERRLLDAQALGRPGHVLFLGHGDEIAKVAQLHLPYLSNIDWQLIIYFTRTSEKAIVLPAGPAAGDSALSEHAPRCRQLARAMGEQQRCGSRISR